MNKKSIVIAFFFALTLQCFGPSGDLDFSGCTIQLQGYVYSKATKAPLDSVLVTLDSFEGTNLQQDARNWQPMTQWSDSNGSFGSWANGNNLEIIGYKVKETRGSFDTIGYVHSALATFSKSGYADTSFRIGNSSCSMAYNVYMREK
jgi:hypothetical protein